VLNALAGEHKQKNRRWRLATIAAASFLRSEFAGLQRRAQKQDSAGSG
jgi:hypothetical protein